jgi:hypothetical protein
MEEDRMPKKIFTQELEGTRRRRRLRTRRRSNKISTDKVIMCKFLRGKGDLKTTHKPNVINVKQLSVFRYAMQFEAPRFHDNWHMKVVRLSALSIVRLYHQELFLTLVSVRG